MSALAKVNLRALYENKFMGQAAALFISANIANAANLLFNMIFARLMGPALFADLTLLLTLKLGVLSFLGAIHFAFSEQTAKAPDADNQKLKAHALSWRSLKITIPIMFIIFALANFIAASLNFSSPLSIALLATAIPFFLPMTLYRGLTQGRVDLPKIILSIQAEWVIRLAGSLILWKMGFGLPGIAAAVALSILAGFLFSTDTADRALHKKALAAKDAFAVKALGVTALPYLILQVAQVLVLDSDIIIAKAVFTPQAAGLVAGLLLIQRVFFFAFLSCSTILQPVVARQTGGEKPAAGLLALLAAIALITAVAMLIIVPNSDLIVKIMLGDAYVDLASIIWISALTGAVFIVSHLCAVYQIARGKNRAAHIVLAFGALQLAILSTVNHFFPALALHSYFSLKLCIQALCAFCMIAMIMWPSQTEDKGRQ